MFVAQDVSTGKDYALKVGCECGREVSGMRVCVCELEREVCVWGGGGGGREMSVYVCERERVGCVYVCV